MSNVPNVLIADDDESLRSLMRAALENANYTVFEAENGKQAVEIFKNQPFDLILLDIRMPVMDGYEACQLMRQHDSNHKIPIVMVTGLDDDSAITQAFLAGADEFIIKPINWTLLAHQIDFWICSSQALNSERVAHEKALEILSAIPDSIFLLQSPQEIQSVHLGDLGGKLAWKALKHPTQLETYFPLEVVAALQHPLMLAKHNQQTCHLVIEANYTEELSVGLNFKISHNKEGSIVIFVRETNDKACLLPT